MNNNEHNPVAFKISKIAKIWSKIRLDNNKAKLFQIICSQEDFIIVNGFIQIEASKYGKSNDSFLMFSVNFDNQYQFLYDISKEWLESFERELDNHPNRNWKDFYELKREFIALNKIDDSIEIFFRKLLVSFKLFEQKKDNLILLTLIPKKIADYSLFNTFMKRLVTLIPNDYGIILIDFKNKENYNELVFDLDSIASQVIIPYQDMSSTYKELATQGNPNDPQVKFRKCLFEMGENAAKKDKEMVDYWGHQMLSIAKGSGDRSFWASAYLIYAGFLFQFKTDNIINLLDTGIQIVDVEYKNNSQSAGILIQLYSYKASYYSIIGNKDEAIKNFLKQAKIAEEVKMFEQMLLANIYALLLIKNDSDYLYKEIIKNSFEKGYLLSDEILKVINFAFITNKYLLLENDKITTSQIIDIEHRMINIYGESWREFGNKISSSIKIEENK